MDDIYVPGNPDGTRMQFNDLKQNGYEIVSQDFDNKGFRVKSTQLSKVLVGVVDEHICIKDAWGENQHQFLYPGATRIAMAV